MTEFTSIFLACSCLTLIQRPVCVGDVLTSADPCPPVGTILKRGSEEASIAVDGEQLEVTGLKYRYPWLDHDGEFTVLYVPPQKEEQR
jgi:hypothetical protein